MTIRVDVLVIIFSSVILLSCPRDPFADVSRAMEQLDALPLTLPQELDDIE